MDFQLRRKAPVSGKLETRLAVCGPIALIVRLDQLFGSGNSKSFPSTKCLKLKLLQTWVEAHLRMCEEFPVNGLRTYVLKDVGIKPNKGILRDVLTKYMSGANT